MKKETTTTELFFWGLWPITLPIAILVITGYLLFEIWIPKLLKKILIPPIKKKKELKVGKAKT